MTQEQQHHLQHQQQQHDQKQAEQKPADPKAPPKYDPKQNPAYNAFEAAAEKLDVNMKSLAETIKNFRPSLDPKDIDKTRGISEATQMMLGLVGEIQNIERWITDGPGGGVGGYAPVLEKERNNPGLSDQPGHPLREQLKEQLKEKEQQHHK